jgi:hypothetical protein
MQARFETILGRKEKPFGEWTNLEFNVSRFVQEAQRRNWRCQLSTVGLVHRHSVSMCLAVFVRI